MTDGSSPPNSTAMDESPQPAADIPPTSLPDLAASSAPQGEESSSDDREANGVDSVQGAHGDAEAFQPDTSQSEGESPADREEAETSDRSHAGGRLPFARRIEDPQRVDGGGRWSVDSTRRRCCRCHKDLPDDQTFDTVLEPATVTEEGQEAAGERPIEPKREEASDLFARRDYCALCFQTDPPATYFAHWRRVLPPPVGGPKKVVNLASLLSHFHQLVETPAVSESERGDDAGKGTAESTASPPLEPHVPTLSPERLRLAYLLALFLVRRRMLKWETVGEEALRLRCKESDRPVDLPLPAMSKEALEEAMAQFEDLFR